MANSNLYRKIIQDMLQRRINAGGRKPKSKTRRRGGDNDMMFDGGLRVGGIRRRVKKRAGLMASGLKKKRRVKRAGCSVGGRKPRKGVVPPALRAWHTHLMRVKRANPHLSMKEAMVKAGGSY